MQNIHSHAWDQALHFEEQTVIETDISRGYRLNLTVKIESFLHDMEPFDRVAVFGLKAKRTGYWVPDNYIADFVAQAPHKLVGFASCDPTQPHYMQELERAVEDLGLQGLKMGPIYAGFDPRDSRCSPIYEYCQVKGLPILFHTGTTYNREAPLEYTRPWLFDEVAIRYPDMRMVLAHLGHPFYDECLAVIRKHPYVYADIAALYYRPWQFYNMMILAQEYGVTHKLLFGTDYPFTTAEESINGFTNANHITGNSGLPRITEKTIEGILTRDAFALLGIS